MLMPAANPECGDVVVPQGPLCNGRTGKSSGARVICFLHNEALPIYIIAVYSKNERANLTQGGTQ